MKTILHTVGWPLHVISSYWNLWWSEKQFGGNREMDLQTKWRMGYVKADLASLHTLKYILSQTILAKSNESKNDFVWIFFAHLYDLLRGESGHWQWILFHTNIGQAGQHSCASCRSRQLPGLTFWNWVIALNSNTHHRDLPYFIFYGQVRPKAKFGGLISC